MQLKPKLTAYNQIRNKFDMNNNFVNLVLFSNLNNIFYCLSRPSYAYFTGKRRVELFLGIWKT